MQIIRSVMSLIRPACMQLFVEPVIIFSQGASLLESISCEHVKASMLCIEHDSENRRIYGPYYPTGDEAAYIDCSLHTESYLVHPGSTVISTLTGALASHHTRMQVKHGVHVFIDCSQVARLVQEESGEVAVHWWQTLGSTMSSSLPWAQYGQEYTKCILVPSMHACFSMLDNTECPGNARHRFTWKCYRKEL